MYNTKTNGYLGQKLKNLTVMRAKLSRTLKDPVPVDFTAAEKEKLEAAMDYLKTTVVTDSNLAQIKEKMVETMAYRIKLMNDQRMDIKESFPFLFVSVELVRK